MVHQYTNTKKEQRINMTNNNIKFNQIKKQNFYTAYTKNGGIILKSYDTIVGYISNDDVLYRVRYSHTTGKQITQFANNFGGIIDTKYLDADALASIIYSYENIKLNCNYNGALNF